MSEDRKHKTIGEKYANWCIHFNGIAHNKCKAYINYSRFDNSYPCFKDKGHGGCLKQYFPNEQEVAAHVASMEAHMEKMRLAFKIVAAIKKEHRGKGWQGIVECPACNGNLRLSHTALNGHVWGKCETKDCLSWME